MNPRILIIVLLGVLIEAQERRKGGVSSRSITYKFGSIFQPIITNNGTWEIGKYV